MTTKYLCDHRNCTVEMIIGPMKNPVNHKQQGMLGTLEIQDVFCRKCLYKANGTKRHVDIQVYFQALFTFLPQNKQNEH